MYSGHCLLKEDQEKFQYAEACRRGRDASAEETEAKKKGFIYLYTCMFIYVLSLFENWFKN